MECRAGCGACCIAMSISTPMPLLPQGKPAGMVCPHLTDSYLCALYGRPERPGCCAGLQPSEEMCGVERGDALKYLEDLELATQPEVQHGSAQGEGDFRVGFPSGVLSE